MHFRSCIHMVSSPTYFDPLLVYKVPHKNQTPTTRQRRYTTSNTMLYVLRTYVPVPMWLQCSRARREKPTVPFLLYFHTYTGTGTDVHTYVLYIPYHTYICTYVRMIYMHHHIPRYSVRAAHSFDSAQMLHCTHVVHHSNCTAHLFTTTCIHGMAVTRVPVTHPRHSVRVHQVLSPREHKSP